MENLENWTYSEFLTYLLIFGANADLDLTRDEEAEIVFKMGEDEYKKVKMVFDSQTQVGHMTGNVKMTIFDVESFLSESDMMGGQGS